MPKIIKTSEASVVEATTSFVARIGDTDVLIQAGDRADADAEVVRKHPDLFKPLTVRFASPRIEQATAAPGEKRGA